MDDDEKVTFDFDDDALSDAADVDDVLSFEFGDSRLDCAKKKWTCKSHAEQSLSHDALLERLDIDGHIGKFWHRDSIINNSMRKLILGGLGCACILTLAWTAADVPKNAERAGLAGVITGGEVADITIPVAGIRVVDLKDNFADARTGHMHGALDIMAPRGTPVLAAVDGKVRKLFTSKAGGITIYETDPAEQMMYYYAHLDHYANDLVEGKVLHRGDVIGYVGSTGNAPANSPHLHFAISVLPPTKEWWKGDPINPYPILTGRGVTKSSSALPLHPAGAD
jgi:hypothetical protein